MKTDILIVGAGFAGASTAFHLSQSFEGSILVIDKEEVSGFHASGRNASLVLQSVEIPEIRRAVAASRVSYQQHAEAIGFRQCGSLLLGKKTKLERVREPAVVSSQYKFPEEVRSQIPLLEGHDFEAALWTPTDGVVDVSVLLQFYLREAQSRGVGLSLNHELKSVSRLRQGGYRIETSKGSIEAAYLFNAAGAWASQLVEMAGASKLSLLPLRRHLFVLGETGQPDPGWPFVWSLTHNFYFRAESGDLLFSLCDEEATDSLEPTVSPGISQALAELTWARLPGLRQATQKRVWSCFRTKSSDGRFLVGWDPAARNFFWVAALSGHGVGASWQIGRLAAERFLDPSHREGPFDPSRFSTSPDDP